MKQPELLSRDQYYEWLKTMPADFCPLCHWREEQVVLRETDLWAWIACRAPYWRYHTMLIPKRHITDATELTSDELAGMIKLYSLALDRYRQAGLAWPDGQPINKYVMFWRTRDDIRDTELGVDKLAHLHIHIAPDKERFWNPILDFEAYKTSMNSLKEPASALRDDAGIPVH